MMVDESLHCLPGFWDCNIDTGAILSSENQLTKITIALSQNRELEWFRTLIRDLGNIHSSIIHDLSKKPCCAISVFFKNMTMNAFIITLDPDLVI